MSADYTWDDGDDRQLFITNSRDPQQPSRISIYEDSNATGIALPHNPLDVTNLIRAILTATGCMLRDDGRVVKRSE